jgi:hypothetical protein
MVPQPAQLRGILCRTGGKISAALGVGSHGVMTDYLNNVHGDRPILWFTEIISAKMRQYPDSLRQA